ncbi:MAG TPA: hypothetical protein VFQ44_08830 [Streptosporangiaceae bacterium]|nr:hypothetical protein [Streptosporangiaceae bacterium]
MAVLGCLIYRSLATLLSWLVLLPRSSASKNAEIAILRHEVTVLRRGNLRPGFDWADRGLIVKLARDNPCSGVVRIREVFGVELPLVAIFDEPRSGRPP